MESGCEKKPDLFDLELSIRTTNALNSVGVKDIDSLLLCTAGTLRKAKYFGEKSLREIRERLLFFGLCLSGDILVQSVAGIALVKEIPQHIEKLNDHIGQLQSDLRDVSLLLKRIRLFEENRS